MNKNSEFDERQILNRGKAYEYSFAAAIVSMVVAYLLVDVVELKVDNYALFQICLWIPLTVCFITMITKDAYDGINSRTGSTCLSVLGLSGTMIIIGQVVNLILGKKALVENGVVTGQVGSFFVGFCCILICVIYWIKTCKDKKKYIEE